MPLRKRTDDDYFANWFCKLCSTLANTVYLIPDTNFCRCYYSNFVKNTLSVDRTQKLRIPRLGIIEVENIFNRNKPKNSKADEQKIRAKERRIAFHTMCEILSMDNDGGELLSNVDPDLLQSFTSIAGKGTAYTWIRKEIAGNLPNLRFAGNIGKDQLERASELFLTCDLMNAMAAVAENKYIIHL